MKYLYIDVNQNELELSRSVNVEDGLWLEAKDWWRDKADANFENDKIQLSLQQFIFHKEWMLVGWKYKNEDMDFEVSDDAKRIITQAIDSKKTVENFLDYPIDITNTELNTLETLINLKPFQERNVKKLLGIPNGANFSVPGAGKTITTLMVWAQLKEQKKLKKLLILAPLSAFEAWDLDNKKMFIDPKIIQQFDGASINEETEILLVNYEQIQNEQKARRLQSWVSRNEAMVVLDEAHRVKGGASSLRWKQARKIVSHAKRVDLLTGTPMPQSYDDLRNLYGLSWPNVDPKSFSDARLQSAVEGGFFVRTTKDQLELPQIKIENIHLNMGQKQEEIYFSLLSTYSKVFKLSNSDKRFLRQKGKAVFTLIAAATNPGLINGLKNESSYLNLVWPPREILKDENLIDVIRSYGEIELPPKYDWVIRYVSEARNSNKKVLVWSNFVSNLEALFIRLANFNPALVYGGVDKINRKDEIEKFRYDDTCNVLLTNPQTLGEGISLHDCCHDAIYIDRTYNAGLYLQSLDRIHRLGLDKDQQTNVFILSSNGTIDSNINRRISEKTERMSLSLSDPNLVDTTTPIELTDETRSELLGLDLLDINDLLSGI